MQIVVENKDPEKSYIMVPVPKASTKEAPAGIEFCVEDLPADVYKEVVLQGLKTLVNRGLSKISGKSPEAINQIMEVVKENHTKIMTGKVRMSAGMRSKTTGAVKTEAMRIARVLIKEAIKAAGKKISSFKASQITVAATALLNHPEKGAIVLKQAEENLKKQEVPKGIEGIIGSIHEDPELVKKNAEAAESKKKPKADKATVVAGARKPQPAAGMPGAHKG